MHCFLRGGGGHKFTVLDKLERLLIQELDKLRVEAQQRESEAGKLVKNTMIGLQKWDNKTEDLISQLHQYRDEYVSSFILILGHCVVQHSGSPIIVFDIMKKQ